MAPPQSGRRPPRILLISDDPTVADSCSRALRLDGHDVWAALSASDGIRLAGAHAPEAIVIDVRAPLAPSLDLADTLRGLPAVAAAAIAVVSGDRRPPAPLLARAATLGVQVRYKPLWLSELVALARSLVVRT